MNSRKRFGHTGLLAFCLMTILLALPVSAGSVYKKTSLIQNKTVSQKQFEYRNGNTYYYMSRIRVPDDGIITIDVKKGDGMFLDFIVHDEDISPDPLYWTGVSTRKSMKIVLSVSRGTYYLIGEGGNRFKWKFNKIRAGNNYCADCAKTLKAGAKVKICQTPDNEFGRWFRINISRRQKLSIWTDQGDKAAVYAQDFKEYRLKRAGKKSLKYSTTVSLDPGTYYLVMNTRGTGDYSERYWYTTLYWR